MAIFFKLFLEIVKEYLIKFAKNPQFWGDGPKEKNNLVNTLNGLLKQSKENKNQTVAELCSITLSRLPTIVVERSELELQMSSPNKPVPEIISHEPASSPSFSVIETKAF